MNFPIIPKNNPLFDENEINHLKTSWLELAFQFYRAVLGRRI